MRRVIVVSAVVALCAPVAARAEDHTVYALGVRYLPAEVTIARGDTLTFANLDPLALTDGHDVTHDADEALFGSDTILAGSSAPVDGVAALPAGAYPFTCSRHSSMRGTLIVSAY